MFDSFVLVHLQYLSFPKGQTDGTGQPPKQLATCYTKEKENISKNNSNKLNQVQQKKLESTLYSTQKVL